MKTLSIIGLSLAGILGLSACSSSPGTGVGGGTGTSTGETSTGTTGAGNGMIGDACVATADCQMGDSCATTDPGGQCVKACAAPADCPAGSTCTDEKKCYKTCAAAADCPRSGYACVDATDVAAKAAKVCDIKPLGGIGDACAATADCELGDDCATTDPGGQCVKVCKTQVDCPTGSTCTAEKKCYKACAVAADCPRMGYACVAAMNIAAMTTMVCDIAP